jgi:hypothetical protein
MWRKLSLFYVSVFSVFVIGFAIAQTGGNTTETRVWQFRPPPTDTNIDRTFEKVATLVTTVGSSHSVCWVNPNSKLVGTKSVEETNLTVTHRRYRVEGGAVQTSEPLPYDKWVKSLKADGTVVFREYCATASPVEQSGHYIYEVKMCITGTETCSPWIESIRTFDSRFGGGTLDGRPTGWWIYAFAPSGTVERVPPKRIEKFEVI